MVDSSPVKTTSESKIIKTLNHKAKSLKLSSEPTVAENLKITPEEKVEVLIKEIIRINPRDFSAFKHALEEFVNDWDK